MKHVVILHVFFHVIRMGYPGPSQAEEILPGPARYFCQCGVDDWGKVHSGAERIFAEGKGDAYGCLFEDGLKHGGALLQPFFDQALHPLQFEMGLHPDPEGIQIDGLSYEIGRPEFQTPDFLVQLVVIGEYQYGDSHGRLSGFQFLEKLKTVHDGHIEVQDDKVEIGVRFDHPQSLEAVAGGENFKVGQHVSDNHAVSG